MRDEAGEKNQHEAIKKMFRSFLKYRNAVEATS